MEQRIRGYLCAVFAQATGRPMADIEAEHGTRARFMIALVKAGSMLARGDDPSAVGVRKMILQTIDQTLSEIAPPAKA
jgi:hypothetical protein